MFGGRLVAHGLDLEAEARAALSRYRAKVGAHLELADQEDCVCFLASEAWRLSEKHDGRVPFESFLRSQLSFRCTDWFRQRLGRSKWTFGSGYVYERERPVPLSLDKRVGAGDNGAGITLAETLADESGGLEEDRAAACGGLLSDRDRHAARDTALIHQRVARLTAERARAARERSAARDRARRRTDAAAAA